MQVGHYSLAKLHIILFSLTIQVSMLIFHDNSLPEMGCIQILQQMVQDCGELIQNKLYFLIILGKHLQ